MIRIIELFCKSKRPNSVDLDTQHSNQAEEDSHILATGLPPIGPFSIMPPLGRVADIQKWLDRKREERRLKLRRGTGSIPQE